MRNLFKSVLAVCAGFAAVSICAAPAGEAALKNIMTRTSIRSYQKKAVPQEFETIMLKAAMAAPTAMNKQPWAFVVIRDAAVREKLAAKMPNAKMISKAPLAIMLCADLSKRSGGAIACVQDLAAATENLLLAAHALGLGAVWCGVFPSEVRMKDGSEILQLPKHIVPISLVVIGYPAREQAPKNKWKPERIHYNKW